MEQMRADQSKPIPRFGVINLAGYGLPLGAVGQNLLIGSGFPRVSSAMVLIYLFIPWFLVHVISFCRQAPCGPRRFYQILIVAMSWYAVNTFVAEASCFAFAVSPPRYSVAIPQLMIVCGLAISFPVLIRAVRRIRQYEVSLP
jgi:hypothetical protein